MGKTLWALSSIALVVALMGSPLLIQCAQIDPDHWTFVVIGDYGDAGPDEAAVATLAKGFGPQFIATLGDNNYPLGQAETIDVNIGQYFSEFIFPYHGSYTQGLPAQNRFFPTLGNHDCDTDVQPYLDYFELPGNERYYDFVYGKVHFLMVNSCLSEPDGRTATSVQGKWLQARLAESTAEFQFVFFHHPPYTSLGGHPPDVEMQWPFAQWGADAVFAGHNHFYERLVVDGIPFFVNGSGGRGRYSFSATDANSKYQNDTDHGAQLLEVEPGKVTVRFYTAAGKLVDSTIITKP